MKKFAVIMAGGTGSRLWPLSREKKPKQFIVIENDKSMLIKTIERICAIVPAENCFIITNESLVETTQSAVAGIIPISNIIAEPMRKNTAACVAYASLFIKKEFGDGILCFVPADGYVKNEKAYQNALETAYNTAEKQNGLVVIGITPTYPATGYGYIQLGEQISENVFKVSRFAEKPNLDTAKKLFESNEYLWNSGILAGSTDAIEQSIKEFLPDHYEELKRALSYVDSDEFNSHLKTAYSNIKNNISFDCGVLENSHCINVVKGDFDWDDIGSLDALAKAFFTETDGNLTKGEHLGIDTVNSVIYSEDVLVTTISVENMIVAAVDDAVLICRRDRVQDIKVIVELMKSRGYESLL